MKRNQLVAFRGGAVTPAYFFKRQKAAIALGRYAWNNRAAILRMGRRFAKRWITRRKNMATHKRYMNRFKRVSATDSSNIRHESFERGTAGASATLERKTLAITEINMNRPPTTNNALGAAPAMNFTLSGFKLCAWVQNAGSKAIEYHWAIIQTKDPGETVENIRNEFFSDPGGAFQNYREFIEFSTDPAWDIRNLCQGINRRNVNIITHQKFKLAPDSNPVVGGVGVNENFSNIRKIERYIKVNKRLAYLNSGGTSLERPFFLCTWYEVIDDLGGGYNTNYATVYHNWHTVGITRGVARCC